MSGTGLIQKSISEDNKGWLTLPSDVHQISFRANPIVMVCSRDQVVKSLTPIGHLASAQLTIDYCRNSLHQYSVHMWSSTPTSDLIMSVRHRDLLHSTRVAALRLFAFPSLLPAYLSIILT